MKRKDFLKKLSGAAGFMLLPLKKLTAKKKTWLLEFHIRGFQYYSGPGLISNMNISEKLKLVREPQNKYDSDAVAVYFRDQKIGFVPKEKNEVISRLLENDAVELKAEIISINKNAAYWEMVSAGVYLKTVHSFAD